MQIHYSDGWFRARKRPGEMWTREQARVGYERRTLYAAIVGPLERPKAFLEFNNTYVGVGFLDLLLREYLSYTFQEVEPGRLFLSMAIHRAFDGGSDTVKSASSYIFKENGRAVISDTTFPNGGRSTRETLVDVSGNWDMYPALGVYDSLMRPER